MMMHGVVEGHEGLRKAEARRRVDASREKLECGKVERLEDGAAPGEVETEDLMARAHSALDAFQGWSEPRVDGLLQSIAETLARNAEWLAEESARETGIGNARDKIVKIRFATLAVLRSVLGRPAAGVVRDDEECGVTEIASPVGVVFGLVPVTNPIATLAFQGADRAQGSQRDRFQLSPEGADGGRTCDRFDPRGPRGTWGSGRSRPVRTRPVGSTHDLVADDASEHGAHSGDGRDRDGPGGVQLREAGHWRRAR
jgi:hypothetical protein